MDASIWKEFMTWMFRTSTFKIPSTFPSQVRACKNILRNDYSSIITTVFDFAIDMSSVGYKIETNNSNLTKTLNKWKKDVNKTFQGKIPKGIKEVAKEYLKERWTSSLIVMNVGGWEDTNGILLPTKVWVMDASGIKVEGNSSLLGDFKYQVKNEKGNFVNLPLGEGKILVQKPFGRWSEKYPSPYFIRRGTLVNYLLKKVLKEKGGEFLDEFIHLLILKKGSERKFIEGHQSVDPKELEEATELFRKELAKKKKSGDKSLWATQWDTSLEDFMPDLNKIFTSKIYEEVDRDLLASLGLIEIIEGIGSTRREAILNPKPFIREVYSAVADFGSLLESLLELIVEKNQEKHRKYFKGNLEIKVIPDTPRIGITELLEHMRSAYDRGDLSKETYLDTLGQNIDVEIRRRKREKEKGIDETLYPHIITNYEDKPNIPDFPEKVPEDRKTGKPETKNFKSSENDLEMAPYKTLADIPDTVKKYPKGAQDAWRKAFNSAWKTYKDRDKDLREKICFKVAWSVLKKWLEKNKGSKEIIIKCPKCGNEWEISSQPEYRMGSEKCQKCGKIFEQSEGFPEEKNKEK